MRLHDYLEFFAVQNGNHPFAEMAGSTITYKQANELANRIGRGLKAIGLNKGDRFVYLSKNTIDYAITYFAASKVGVVPVPLNYRLAPREWLYIINDSEAKLLLAEREFCERIETVSGEFTHVSQKICLDAGDQAGWLDYTTWLDSEDTSNLDLDILESDQLYQMYTSGTTGLPKGAVLSQRAVDSNLAMIACLTEMALGKDRMIVVAPLYHAAAGITLKTTISRGSTIVLHREFDPVEVVRSLSEDGITVGVLVPAMIQACLVSVPDVAEREFSALRMMVYGASPIAEETLREAMRIFDCDFCQIFGMTETSAMATGLTAADHRLALKGHEQLLLSAGRAALGTEIKIVDDANNAVPANTLGEIAIKGPQLMDGYWHLDEATEKSLKGGWMHTGDAALMDDQGYIFIQDRIKDMIVSGGENVYPREVENALFEHPAVADAAVIGIPSEQWGEAVMAFLVLRDSEVIDESEMIEFCRERLAGYKIPRKIEYLDEIPRNTSGKVLKKDLREPFWAGIERRVS